MKRLVRFELEDGSPVYLEIDARDAGDGPTRMGGEREAAGLLEGGAFTNALAKVRPAASALVQALRDVNAPSEIGLEFSLTFNTKVGAFVFTSDTSAAVTVSLKWANPAEAKHNPLAQTHR